MLSLGTVNKSVLYRTSIGRFLSPRNLIFSPDSQLQDRTALIPAQTATALCDHGNSTEWKGVFGTQFIPPETEPDQFSKVGLRRESMPRHVAAILDGNRRWAKAHGKDLDYSPFCQGYISLADLCIKWGVETLSCFIFSTENWKRPEEANDLLFRQFQRCLDQSLDIFRRKGIKAAVIGEKTRLPKWLQEVTKQVEEDTKSNTKLELNFAVSYGGKWDIVQAVRSMSRKAKAGEIEPQHMDEALMDRQLSTCSMRVPDPDLMIRTGGDRRLSNFLMWQMAHTEFYFTDVYGPDFGEPHFVDALRWFQQCDRLFGN